MSAFVRLKEWFSRERPIADPEGVIQVIREVREKLRLPSTDLCWTRYESVDELLADLDDHITRLQQGDLSRLRSLEMLFAPTGILQDVSIDSGWGAEYIQLAARFDNAAKRRLFGRPAGGDHD